MSRVLLVSPSFHGYSSSIANALRRLGHDVMVCHYDAAATPVEQAWVRASVELPGRLGIPPEPRKARMATQRALEALDESRPEVVLVVKGDRLEADFFDALDGVAGRPRVRRALWLYDEIRRTRHTHDSLARYDGVASYSAADVDSLSTQGLTAVHVPLAYDPSYDPAAQPRLLDTVFIGARYPVREELLKHLVTAGLPVRAYGRDWSEHPYDRLRTWSWRRPTVPGFRELPRREAYEVMTSAASTVNSHGDQDGFTMRTFEACGVGAVQLIDRADVSEFYEPGREVAVFSDADELVELAQRAVGDERWAAGLRESGRRRTLDEHTFDHRVRTWEALWA